MKQYTEQQNGGLTLDGVTVPNDPANRHYRQALEEIEAGDAELTPFDHAAYDLQQLEQSERAWRDAELQRADIELYKVQDGEGSGTVTEWREYRCALRDYPQQPDFPEGTRPGAPDA